MVSGKNGSRCHGTFPTYVMHAACRHYKDCSCSFGNLLLNADWQPGGCAQECRMALTQGHTEGLEAALCSSKQNGASNAGAGLKASLYWLRCIWRKANHAHQHWPQDHCIIHAPLAQSTLTYPLLLHLILAYAPAYMLECMQSPYLQRDLKIQDGTKFCGRVTPKHQALEGGHADVSRQSNQSLSKQPCQLPAPAGQLQVAALLPAYMQADQTSCLPACLVLRICQSSPFDS